jgi:hypothetical protein
VATAAVNQLPALPPGFKLDEPQQPQSAGPPPLPPGFVLDDPNAPAQQPLQTPERWRLEDQLKRDLAAADEAGKTLERTETAVGYARPLLRGAVDLADGVTALPRLAASVPAAAANLAGANLRLPATYSLKELGSDGGKSLAPRNKAERYASAVTQGVGGALGGIGLGTLAAGAGGTTGAVGSQFAAQPALQGVQAVTGPVASEGARDLGAGPVGQTVAGVLGSMFPGAVTGAAQKVGSGLSRTPEAQRLLDAGVDLTPGQLNPKGFVNQLEETVQSAPLVGPVVRGARDNARSTFQRAAAQEGSAPGTAVAQGNPAQMLDEAYRSFQPLYDQAKGFPVRPVIMNASGPNVPLDRALAGAVANRGIRATADDRAAVQGFLDDQLTKPLQSSDDLLNIRAAVRAESRAASASGQSAQAQILDDADAAITQALDSQLPPDALRALRTADAKYGDYKTVEKAVYTGSTKPDGFTPFDLSKAVKQSNRGDNLGQYARGGGGPVRQLADDATVALETRAPANGARLAALPIGALLSPVILGGAATQTGRRLAAGNTDTQRAIASALAGIKPGQAARQGATNQLVDSLSDQERLALAFQEATQRRKERR